LRIARACHAGKANIAEGTDLILTPMGAALYGLAAASRSTGPISTATSGGSGSSASAAVGCEPPRAA
jgi:hypothetical protein